MFLTFKPVGPRAGWTARKDRIGNLFLDVKLSRDDAVHLTSGGDLRALRGTLHFLLRDPDQTGSAADYIRIYKDNEIAHFSVVMHVSRSVFERLQRAIELGGRPELTAVCVDSGSLRFLEPYEGDELVWDDRSNPVIDIQDFYFSVSFGRQPPVTSRDLARLTTELTLRLDRISKYGSMALAVTAVLVLVVLLR